MTQEAFIIAVCDDDELFRDTLRRQICAILQKQKISFEILMYPNAEALLNDINGGKRFSLIMLDVMMDGLDGMEFARSLRKKGWNTPTVFISSNRDYALSGYEMDALRFLAKPIDTDRLREALMVAKEKTKTHVLLLRNAEGLHRVETDKITYAEVWERGVLIHLYEGEPLFGSQRMGALELTLPETAFFRCHQGYIVHFAYIRIIQATDVYMIDGSCVPVSRYKLTELRRRFTAYLNQ